jgi:Rrf2 family protein
MLSSSRFVVAIHALSVLARSDKQGPVCSSTIAESVHTNPVVIRRMMAELERAGLVRSVSGRCGGFALERAANSITLADIYLAVEGESVFRMHNVDPNTKCPIAQQVTKVLSTPFKSAESALSASLAKTSLHDVTAAFH